MIRDLFNRDIPLKVRISHVEVRVKNVIRHLLGKPRYLTPTETGVLLDIIAHPDCMPTRTELSYTNSHRSKEKVDAAISTLFAGGYITSVMAPTESEEIESVYALTPYGASRASSVCIDVPALREEFRGINHPSEISRLQSLERPETFQIGDVYIPAKLAEREQIEGAGETE